MSAITINSATLKQELLDLIAREGGIARDKLTPDATLDSLGFASVDMVMLLLAVEEKYGVYLSVDTELSSISTLPDLLTLLADRVTSAEPAKTATPSTAQTGSRSD